MPEDCAIFVLNGTGEVLTHTTSAGETKESIKKLLKIIKKRCDEHKWDYPKFIFTDNAAAQVIYI